MINDINYLILTLTRENKEDIANILIKVKSSLEVNIRLTSAANRLIGSTTGFHNHGEGPY